MLKKLNTLPLEMAEDENHNLFLVRGGDDEETPPVPFGLYQVVMTMQTRRGKRKGKPVVTTYMVLAESERGAISQVEDIAAGGALLSGLDARESGMLKGVAHRHALHIRGWGSQTV